MFTSLVAALVGLFREEDHAASGAESSIEVFPSTCSYGTPSCIGDRDGGHADACPAWERNPFLDEEPLVGERITWSNPRDKHVTCPLCSTTFVSQNAYLEHRRLGHPRMITQAELEYAQYEFGVLPEEYDEFVDA